MSASTAPAVTGDTGAVTAPIVLRYPESIEAFIPEKDWDTYSKVIACARARGIRFAMGGGFATSFYTAAWRNTKDMDLCVEPQDRDAMVEATREAGLRDLFDDNPYDRGWIYRSTREGVIVDVIWQLANYRGVVDAAWTTRGPEVRLHGASLCLVPPEEMIWSKIHVVQRERCDFPDVINLLYATGAALDWERLIGRMHGEERLLGAALLLFTWLAPGRARSFPRWIWQRLGITAPGAGPERDEERIRALESRPWFAPSV